VKYNLAEESTRGAHEAPVAHDCAFVLGTSSTDPNDDYSENVFRSCTRMCCSVSQRRARVFPPDGARHPLLTTLLGREAVPSEKKWSRFVCLMIDCCPSCPVSCPDRFRATGIAEPIALMPRRAHVTLTDLLSHFPGEWWRLSRCQLLHPGFRTVADSDQLPGLYSR
jgi:hypothetical protein